MAKKKIDYSDDNDDVFYRNKGEVKDSVEELQININNVLEQFKTPIDDLFLRDEMLPKVDLNLQLHDYEKDIELIKIESKETLECLANLYLTDDLMKTRNIYKIIRDDSEKLAELNFSISCAKRALISCMTQLDMGTIDPLLYQSVALFQKEMRDTIKMCYDLQKKMKEFYKELKDEMVSEIINPGIEQYTPEKDVFTVVSDSKMLNDFIDRIKDDPEIMKNFGL